MRESSRDVVAHVEFRRKDGIEALAELPGSDGNLALGGELRGRSAGGALAAK